MCLQPPRDAAGLEALPGPSLHFAAAALPAATLVHTCPSNICSRPHYCRSSGIATVYYSQGQCSVQSGFLLSTACQQSGSIQLQAPTPQWTQGLQAVGNFSCAGGECAVQRLANLSFASRNWHAARRA